MAISFQYHCNHVAMPYQYTGNLHCDTTATVVAILWQQRGHNVAISLQYHNNDNTAIAWQKYVGMVCELRFPVGGGNYVQA